MAVASLGGRVASLPWPRAGGLGCPPSVSQGQRGWVSIVGRLPPARSAFLSVSHEAALTVTTQGAPRQEAGLPDFRTATQQGPAPPEPAGRLLAPSGAADSLPGPWPNPCLCLHMVPLCASPPSHQGTRPWVRSPACSRVTPSNLVTIRSGSQVLGARLAKPRPRSSARHRR